MTTLVIEHDTDGRIVGWRYEAADDYEPSEREIAPDDYDHRKLHKKKVDTSTGEVIDDPDWKPKKTLEDVDSELKELKNSGPVQRRKISKQSKDDFKTARTDGDLQTQLDILFEIVTGETV